MEIRYSPNPEGVKRLTTSELRDSFLVQSIFVPDTVRHVYSDSDRAIIGGAVPTEKPLVLKSSKREMAAEYFTQRREVGVINIGGSGTIVVDGTTFRMDFHDTLYIGRGSKNVEFRSDDVNAPAAFYILSYPAHASHPTQHAAYSENPPLELGSQESSNKRNIVKTIHPEGIKSCQLVMGITTLQPGSVWNTMPAHTHQRRTEIYMYYALDDDARVIHLMGEPNETRHIIVKNREAVISPSWSIHCGPATQNYTFIWGMGGENQAFDDMDFIPMGQLR